MRHLLRVQGGLGSHAYYLSHFTSDILFFMVLNFPSIVMLCLGYRNEGIAVSGLAWLLFIEVLSKLAFCATVLPMVYLLGFW